MTRHLEKPPPGKHAPAPQKSAPRRMPAWKMFLAATVFIAAGGLVLTPLLADRSGDRLSDAEKAELVTGFSKLSAVQLPVVPATETAAALDQMKLVPDARRAMQRALEPAPAADPAASPSRSSTRLAWVTVWDSRDEDGDAITLSSAGYEVAVVLTKAPQRIAVPIDGSATIKVTGLRDGGGGITLGIQSGSGAIALPVMAPGQILTLPVAF